MWYVTKKYIDEEDVRLVRDCREGMRYTKYQQSMFYIYKVGNILLMPISFYGSYKQAMNSKQYAFASALGFDKELVEKPGVYQSDFEKEMDELIKLPGNYRIGHNQVHL